MLRKKLKIIFTNISNEKKLRINSWKVCINELSGAKKQKYRNSFFKFFSLKNSHSNRALKKIRFKLSEFQKSLIIEFFEKKN